MRYDRDNYTFHRDRVGFASRAPAQRAKSVCEKEPLLAPRAMTYALIIIAEFMLVYVITREIFHRNLL